MKKTTGPGKGKPMMKDMKPAMRMETRLALKKASKPNYPQMAVKVTEDIKPMGIKKSTKSTSLKPFENEMTGESSVITPKRNTIRKVVRVEAKTNRKIASMKQKTADKVGKLEKKAASLKAAGKPFRASVASSRAGLEKGSMKRVEAGIRRTTGDKVATIKYRTERKQKKEAILKKEKASGAMTPQKLQRRRDTRKTAAAIGGAIGAYGTAALNALKNK